MFGGKRGDNNVAKVTPETSGNVSATQVNAMGDSPLNELAKNITQYRQRLSDEVFEVADLTELMSMENSKARLELAELARALLGRMQNNTLDIGEQDNLVTEIVNEILGLGPLESLIARDDIADIMVCGPNKVFIEVKGKLQLTSIVFRSEEQLRNIAQRIVGAVGRRVDENSPICDARLKDGSRVAIIIPPVAIDGTIITIRKFKKDKLKLSDLVAFDSISPEGAKILEIISAIRLNILVSGGTGSGKAQPLDTKILTPTGWRLMGDMKPNMVITAHDGSATKVNGVFPQGEKEIFKVTFIDGRSTRCCNEHLWKIITRAFPLGEVVNLETIQKRIQNEKISIPLVSPVGIEMAPILGNHDSVSQLSIHERLETLGSLIGKKIKTVSDLSQLYDRAYNFEMELNDLDVAETIKEILWSLGASAYICPHGKGYILYSRLVLDHTASLEITSIESVGFQPAQCISIDHPDHLYVTDDYVVTHNTTLLNCLTLFIDPDESIITCEDAAELQLQQPNVRRLETRPNNSEGEGEIPMFQLVKASLRHRPERIIIGEVRGPEAFDLIQAMNTGHDGSMGTVHSNSPREAISRMESLIAMGGLNLPAKQLREQICSSINVIIQITRLRDGSRKITHITEITGMEGETPVLQDIMVLEIDGEDGEKVKSRHRITGIRPKFWDRARYYGLEIELGRAIEEGERNSKKKV
jgi:Flp pilus assembly CpaF family ATPase